MVGLFVDSLIGLKRKTCEGASASKNAARGVHMLLVCASNH